MNLNWFKKTTSVNDGFVDWASTHSMDSSHSVQSDFFRGTIKKLVWKDNLPKIQLHEIKKFNPKSKQWSNVDSKSLIFFDFVKLKKKDIQFASGPHQNGAIHFMIFFGVQGFIIPRARLPENHSFFV